LYHSSDNYIGSRDSNIHCILLRRINRWDILRDGTLTEKVVLISLFIISGIVIWAVSKIDTESTHDSSYSGELEDNNLDKIIDSLLNLCNTASQWQLSMTIVRYHGEICKTRTITR